MKRTKILITVGLVITTLTLTGCTTNTQNNTVYEIQGSSMNPTLSEGQQVISTSKEPQDGDLVLAELPDGTTVIKRLKGDMLVSDGNGANYSLSNNEATIISKAEPYLGGGW